MSPSAVNIDGSQETITRLSPRLSEMSSIDPLIALLALTYKTISPSPIKQDRLLTLMYTITLKQPTQPKIYSHEEQRNSFIRFVSPALNGMAGLQELEKAVQSEAEDDPEGFRTFWQLEERNLLKEMVEDGNMGGASPGAEVVFLDTFVGSEGARCKVGMSREGTFMLVEGEVEIGETVRVVRNEEVGGVFFHGRKLGVE